MAVTLLVGASAPEGVAPGENSGGSVDWVGGYVEGVGHGTAQPSGNRPGDRLKAVRAAEVMAQRALAETIHGVRVDGKTRTLIFRRGDGWQVLELEAPP